jgi:hypothetical protein
MPTFEQLNWPFAPRAQTRQASVHSRQAESGSSLLRAAGGGDVVVAGFAGGDPGALGLSTGCWVGGKASGGALCFLTGGRRGRSAAKADMFTAANPTATARTIAMDRMSI